MPTDAQYVTGEVPAEMREGVEITAAEVAPPTAITDVDGMPAQITRIRVPRPEHIPAGPPRLAQIDNARLLNNGMAPSGGTLRYDFPLLPGVQCTVMLVGEPNAGHLEQLVELLSNHARVLRAQETRDAKRPKVKKQQEVEADGGKESVPEVRQ